MIEPYQNLLNLFFTKFNTPTCSRFTNFFKSITKNKTLNNKEKIETQESKIKNYRISENSIKNGIDKRTSIIIKGIPVSFGCINFYKLLKEFCSNINFFYIPYYIFKKEKYMYAIINVKNSKSILNIYQCLNIIKKKFKNMNYYFGNINIFYCKTQGYYSLKKKYTDENLNIFLVCEKNN